MLKLRALACSFLILIFTTPAFAQWTAEGGVLLRGKIVTMDENDTVKNGSLYIKDGKIEAILGPNAPVPDGAIEVKTDGVIYPGLMNLHNHPAYDFLPPYPVPKDYNNRNQWPSGKCYERLVNNPKVITTDPALFARQTEALKYALVKEIVGGTTASQGAPNDLGAAPLLTRDVEHTDLPGKIAGSVLPIDRRFVADLKRQRDRIGELQAWFFHLAEGKDEVSRLEYSNPDYSPRKPPGPKNVPGLKELGLVRKNLVAIHATALKEADFKDWKKTTGEGAKIVWSPLSNILLYGETTDILAAIKHDATIALGTDWTPSGSKNLLWELKVADQYVRQKLDGKVSSKDLVAMVTRNPAKLLGWEDQVGMIKKGMVADLVVMDSNGRDVYKNLIDSTERNVELVFIGGEPLYGDTKLMKKLKGDKGARGLETLDELERSKSLDLKRDIRKGGQSLRQIEQALSVAAKLNAKELAKVLNEGDPSNKKNPYGARSAMKDALVAIHKANKLPVPPSLKNDAYPITAGQVQEYLDHRFPYAEPLKKIDSVFQENDDRFFEGFLSNLHLAGDDPVIDFSKLADRDGIPLDVRARIEAAHEAAHAHRGGDDAHGDTVAPYSRGMTDLLSRRVAEGKDAATSAEDER